MNDERRIFEDLSRVASGAASSLASLKTEIEARVRDQLERVLARMDLVRRDEFEAVRDMAAKARAENEQLAARIAELEAKAPKRATSARRVAAKAAPKGGPKA